MGTVFEAVNIETDEPAAVKLLAPALAGDGGFRERFQAEIETLRKLKHPNIVRIFGFGQEHGNIFYAMELVPGSSLEEELRNGRRFDWREVAQIGVQICRALRHAHDRGVIHRDIKPANLLLAEDGHVMLSDFGIARLFGASGNTAAGTMVGTVEYMAPEQAGGGPVGPHSDLCSLGAVFYALLAGRPPFVGRTIPEIVEKRQSTEPQPVGRFVADVPAEFERIIAELLQKDPAKRISSATVLGRRLEAMQHALATETGAPEVGAPEVGAPEVGAPEVGAPEVTDEGNLPTTQIMDQPPGEPDQGLLETKGTSSFVVSDEAAETESEAGDDEPGTAANFTTIGEHELDVSEPQTIRSRIVTPQTALLAVALMAVGFYAWYLLQPPSADRLYEEITAAAKAGSINELLRVDDRIDEFLGRFPGDSRCDGLHQYKEEIELHRLERKFERRARGLAGGEELLPIEHDYLEALNYLHLDTERGRAKLRALVDLYDHGHEISGPASRCLELARRRLGQLDEQIGAGIVSRLANVEKIMDQADGLMKTDPQRARKMYNAVLELYGEKPWAAEAVRRAREALSRPATAP